MYSFRLCFPQKAKVGNPTHGLHVGSWRGTQDMWLALATVTLAAAIGFSILALAIQFER
jgi:hypothetical protein